MLVAIGRVGVDAGGLNREAHLRLRGLVGVELDGAGEVGEAAADLGDEVADLEGGFRVGLVDGEGADGGGGASLESPWLIRGYN